MISPLKNILPLSLSRADEVVPTPIGEIFSDTFERGSLGSNYTPVGAISTAMNGTDMILSGGAGAAYGAYNKYTAWGTCLENWVLTAEFQVGSKTASSEGFTLGMKTNSSYSNRSIYCSVAHGTGASGGKSYLAVGTTLPENVSLLSSSAGQLIDNGDEMRMTLTRSGLTITQLTENLTKATSETQSHTFNLLYSSTSFMHNTGCPIIGNFGGIQNVHNWSFTTTDKKNIKTLFLGDSLTHGVSASSIANRWANEVMNGSVNEWAVSAGGGDYTATTLTKIEELKLINPRYCVLQLGGNDVRFGVAVGTQQTNYTSLVNQLTSAGITCIHLLTAPDNIYDMTVWNSWLSSNYTTIDCYTPLWSGVSYTLNAAYNSGDGRHWNNAGHDVNANTVITNAPQIL